MEFYQILDKLMEERGITAYQLYQRIGISQTAIGNWRKGRQLPTVDKLKLLSETLGVSADYLLYGEDRENITPDSVDTPCGKQEKALLKVYEHLNEYNKGRLIERAYTLLENQASEVSSEFASFKNAI